MSKALYLLAILLTATACERWIYNPKPGVIEGADAQWRMEGGGPERLSRFSEAPRVDFGDGRRSISALLPEPRSRSGETVSPLVVGEWVVYGTGAKAVAAVNWETSEVVWQHKLRGGMLASPAYGEGAFYVADDHGWVEALDLGGNKKWEFRMPAYVAAPLVIEGKKLYVLSVDQNLYCLDVATGKPLWRYEKRHDREGPIWRASSPAVGGGSVFLGLSDGQVVSLDADFGRVHWKRDISGKTAMPDITCGPAVDGGVVYAGALEGPFVALKGATGEVLWKQPYRAVGSVAVGAEMLYFGNIAGELVAARKSDGETLWKVKLDGGTASPPVVAGDRVFVGATLGSFYEIDAADGRVLQTWSPATGIQGRPWVGQRGVAVLSNSGMLHLFNRRR